MAFGAQLAEIFSSIQGEGLCIGLRQLFVRFSPCNLACTYCDTPNLGAAQRECVVERTPGRGDFYTLQNPVGLEALSGAVEGLLRQGGMHHSISLTGGEPLLQAEFLKAWLPTLKGVEKIYLETNGTLPGALAEVVDLIDIIAMDIKLPATSGIEPAWEAHRRFIEIGRGRGLFIKVVVAEETPDGEFMEAVELAAAGGREIPFIIQPLTEGSGPCHAPSAARLLSLYGMAAARLDEVRVIPQSHKMMGLL